MVTDGRASRCRRDPLFLHLTDLLGDRGIAVERFDRRRAPPGQDVRIADQASDARIAMARLRDQTDARVGAWVPRQLPDAGSWPDMDFDPREAISRVRCPVLAFWSSADEWVPIERSIARWRPAGALTTLRLPDATHEPSPGALYERELCRFLDAI